MGWFGDYLYADGEWSDVDLDDPPSTDPAEPWLLLQIHDSDFAIVRYAPEGDGSGEAYIGCTPRSYFEDDDASAPTDVAAEARGLAAWARVLPAQTAADPEQVAGLLAGDDDPDPVEDDDDERADEGIFVEVKCLRFLDMLGSGLPRELQELRDARRANGQV